MSNEENRQDHSKTLTVMSFNNNDDVSFPEEPQEIKQTNTRPSSQKKTASARRTAPSDMPVRRTTGGGNRNSSRNTSKKTRVNLLPFNIALTAITVIVDILVVYELFYTTRFSALSQSLFIKINLIAMLVVLLLNAFVFVTVRMKKLVLLGIAAFLIIVSLAGGGYAAYALTKVDTNLNEITAKEHDTDINTSFVIYTKKSGQPIMDVADLKGAVVGAVDGTDAAAVGKQRLEAEGVEVTYSNYLSFAETFKALVTEEIDCAILPANYANAIGTEEQLEPFIEDTAAILTFKESVVQTGTDGAEKDLTKEPFTVLISGENEGLADTIIIVSVNPISMKVTMTSIARDSYVPIACYGYAKSKINSSHAVSEACLVETVEYLTGIDIDYTVEFNFASVIQVVDAVGGVDVYNPIEFMGQCWDVNTDSLVVLPIPAGNVHLNGQQALGFVRERYAFEEGDFARQQHQQEVIEQIVKRVMDTRDPNTYLKILDAAGANIRTNLSTDQMVQFVSYAMKKAKRYYNSDNPVGVLNIINSGIAGWAAQLWDDSLQMYLYIWNVFNGACIDTANYVERNLNMATYPETPVTVSWSASDEDYEPDAISADWYNGEVGPTVIGGPTPAPEPETPEVVEQPTEEQTIAPEPTEAPAEPEPTTEPEPEPPVDEGGGEGGGEG